MKMPDSDALLHRESFHIRSYEIDPHKNLAPASLVRLMQEASMRHVINLNLSVWDLEPQGLSWVLIRQSFQIHQLPALGQFIEVITHPSGFEKVFTHRDFRVLDANGEEIVTASTTWLLLNTASRRMTRIPAALLDFNQILPPANKFLPRTPEKMPEFVRTDYSKSFRVGWFDLDFNFHLTNSLYVAWMLETNEHSFLKEAQLQEMQVWYLAEGLPDDQLEGETEIIDNRHRIHRLVRSSDGKILAMGSSFWKQKSP
jgi:medium-chain acyl-[acyl-carrier-protein] hydrolase